MCKKQTFIFSLVTTLFISCTSRERELENQLKKLDGEIAVLDSAMGEVVDSLKTLSLNPLKFNNISEVVHDKHSTTWVKIEKDSPSTWLHFNLYQPDTLQIEFTPECWASFPIIASKEKIVVYWDNNLDTKYDFPIVKEINKTEESFIGKPFIIFSLKNDSTLSANYIYPELIERLNRSEKERLLFPETFIATYTYR